MAAGSGSLTIYFQNPCPQELWMSREAHIPGAGIRSLISWWVVCHHRLTHQSAPLGEAKCFFLVCRVATHKPIANRKFKYCKEIWDFMKSLPVMVEESHPKPSKSEELTARKTGWSPADEGEHIFRRGDRTGILKGNTNLHSNGKLMKTLSSLKKKKPVKDGAEKVKCEVYYNVPSLRCAMVKDGPQKSPKSLVEPLVMEGRASLQAALAGLRWELKTQSNTGPLLSWVEPSPWGHLCPGCSQGDSAGCLSQPHPSPLPWTVRANLTHFILVYIGHYAKPRASPSPGLSYPKGSVQTFLGLPAHSSSWTLCTVPFGESTAKSLVSSIPSQNILFTLLL